MKTLLTKLTGTDGVEAVSHVAWELRHPWSPIVLFVLMALAVGFAIWSYRRFADRGPWARGVMTVCRIVALLLMLIILFEPVLHLDLSRRTNNRVLVLIDTSESMSIRDVRNEPEEIHEAALALGMPANTPLSAAQSKRAANASRFELACGALTNPATGMLQLIQPGFDIVISGFDEFVKPLAVEGRLPALGGIDAEGRATALGTAMQLSLAGYGAQPLAGMVILSDFAWNQGADPLAVARELKDSDIPIYPIGVGLVDPPDISITRLYAKQTLFAGDAYSVKVQMRSSASFARSAAQIDLTVGDIKETRIVTLTGGQQIEDFELTAPKEAGRYRLEAFVSSAGEEAVIENNTDFRPIDVTDEKIRVLYVEGLPRWEYRYLRWVLLRDHRLDVKFLLTQGDPDLASYSPTYLHRFPEAGRTGLDFDLVIIGDVAATYFNSEQTRWLVDLVNRRGGALMMVSGPLHAPSSYRDTPIAELLPVRVHDAPWTNLNDLEMPVVTTEGLASGVTRLADTASATAEIWRHMRPLSYLPPVSAKPAATVLMALSSHKIDGDRYPFLAWHRYGNGKSMFVASDKLWRIRYKVGRLHHERFWAQTVQFLALSRLMAGNTRIVLETDRQTYGAGESCQLFANVLDPFFEPIVEREYVVTLQNADDDTDLKPVTLAPVPDIPGFYQGTVILGTEGAYQVLAPEADREFANSPRIAIEDISVEMRDPGMRAELAHGLAQVSGGTTLSTMQNLPRLAQSISARSPLRVERAQVELWDTPLAFIVILLAAGVEWIIRRKKRMV